MIQTKAIKTETPSWDILASFKSSDGADGAVFGNILDSARSEVARGETTRSSGANRRSSESDNRRIEEARPDRRESASADETDRDRHDVGQAQDREHDAGADSQQPGDQRNVEADGENQGQSENDVAVENNESVDAAEGTGETNQAEPVAGDVDQQDEPAEDAMAEETAVAAGAAGAEAAALASESMLMKLAISSEAQAVQEQINPGQLASGGENGTAGENVASGDNGNLQSQAGAGEGSVQGRIANGAVVQEIAPTESSNIAASETVTDGTQAGPAVSTTPTAQVALNADGIASAQVSSEGELQSNVTNATQIDINELELVAAQQELASQEANEDDEAHVVAVRSQQVIDSKGEEKQEIAGTTQKVKAGDVDVTSGKVIVTGNDGGTDRSNGAGETDVRQVAARGTEAGVAAEGGQGTFGNGGSNSNGGASYRGQSHEQVVAALDSHGKANAVSEGGNLAEMFDTRAIDAPERVDMQENIDRIVRAAQAVHARGGSRMQIRLEPPELGTLRIDVRQSANGLVVRFETGSVRTQQLLQQNSGQLRTALDASGMNNAQVDIQLRMNLRNDGGADQQNNQPQSQQQGQSDFEDQQQQQQAAQQDQQQQADQQQGGRQDGSFEWQSWDGGSEATVLADGEVVNSAGHEGGADSDDGSQWREMEFSALDMTA